MSDPNSTTPPITTPPTTPLETPSSPPVTPSSPPTTPSSPPTTPTIPPLTPPTNPPTPPPTPPPKPMVPIEQPDYVCCNVPGEIESVETIPQEAEEPVNVDVTLDVAPTINLTFGKPKVCLVNYGATKSYFPKKKPCN